MPLTDFAETTVSGKKVAKKNQEVDFDVAVFKLVPKVTEILKEAREKRFLSPNNERALKKIESGRFNFNKTERNALKMLLDRLGIELS